MGSVRQVEIREGRCGEAGIRWGRSGAGWYKVREVWEAGIDLVGEVWGSLGLPGEGVERLG